MSSKTKGKRIPCETFRGHEGRAPPAELGIQLDAAVLQGQLDELLGGRVRVFRRQPPPLPRGREKALDGLWLPLEEARVGDQAGGVAVGDAVVLGPGVQQSAYRSSVLHTLVFIETTPSMF